MQNILPLSLYIHIPWCLKKCPYCDFNSHAVKDSLPEKRYVDCLLADLARDVARYEISRSLQSIFIGGGTPSLFSPESINRLLRGIETQLTFVDDIEITLEANPSTFEFEKFAEFRATGINRLSIGVQSFDETLLSELGRVHSGKEAIAAAEMAHKVGFENFNLDLMFGLPKSSLAHSERDIRTAIALQPTHLSFYQLTLEPNTYFYRYPPVLPSDEFIFAIQTHCQRILAQHNYAQYEVSAYSLANKHCRHNVNYWQFGDYLGIGAGAHGKLSLASSQIIRTQKNKHPERYENAQDVIENVIETIDLPLEFLMNQLRLKQGFNTAHYEMATGLNAETLEPALSECVQAGLLIQRGNHYTCTEQGWNFLDDVLQKFLP
jgi:putative oxygen-independent coproporphyrinogen III oxidase